MLASPPWLKGTCHFSPSSCLSVVPASISAQTSSDNRRTDPNWPPFAMQALTFAMLRAFAYMPAEGISDLRPVAELLKVGIGGLDNHSTACLKIGLFLFLLSLRDAARTGSPAPRSA